RARPAAAQRLRGQPARPRERRARGGVRGGAAPRHPGAVAARREPARHPARRVTGSAETLSGLLRAAAGDAPDAEAFRYRGERLTYRDWDGLADRLVGAFAAR